MKWFIIVAFIILSRWGFAQADLNYGSVGLVSGLRYSTEQNVEKFHYFTNSEVAYTIQTFNQYNEFGVFGSLFYQSKRYVLNSNWALQFSVEGSIYQTKNVIQISAFLGNSEQTSTTVNYADALVTPVQRSSALNVAPTISLGATRTMGNSSFFHFALGYLFDYALTSEIEWVEPFQNNQWQTINFPNEPGERINQDLYMTFNPYWHLGDKLQLGIDLSVPLPLYFLFEPNQIFIPGKHNNFMLKNYFLGIQLALRLDTSYDGCGSCP